MAVSTMDIAWMAGLLEGEACFCIGRRKVKDKEYKRVLISLVMTDHDVMRKAGKLFGAEPAPLKPVKLSTKPLWRLSICGTRAIEWMMTIYPLMGERRQNKISQCIAAWKASPCKSRLRRNTYARSEVT